VPERTFDIRSGHWKVVFTLPPEATPGPVWLCGEFNEWSRAANPMDRRDDGSHVAVLGLAADRSYRFRYYLGEDRWENDWAADAYVPNEFGGADSVLELPPAPSDRELVVEAEEVVLLTEPPAEIITEGAVNGHAVPEAAEVRPAATTT
jgi:hypothetical protein